MGSSRNMVESFMRNHLLVFFFVSVLLLFGIIALLRMNKNEFPTAEIRVAVVAVVYPGATAEEIESQIASKVENYLFTFADIDKTRTYSYSRDGMLYVFPTLVQGVDNAALTWSRIRQGLRLFQTTDLPQGVIATAVIDDFGNSSSLLLAIESNGHPSRELREYTDRLCNRLRTIGSMGNIKVLGEQREEIAILMDPVRLTQYAISQSMVSTELAAHGVRTVSGRASNEEGSAIIHVSIPFDDMYSLSELIIFSDPVSGQSVRLKDVATLQRRYKEDSPYVTYTNDSVASAGCVILSMEMRPGNNVVQFGREVEREIAAFTASIPPDIHIHRITDQPKVVDRSVRSFLMDLLEAMLVVVVVMLLLFPLRTALVSSTSVPVCFCAGFAIMYALNIELNTVTLAALIVVLGMIVDDSVVVIDGYSDLLSEGHSRWYSAVVSTSKLLPSMLIATCSISAMFFPMLKFLTGDIRDFVNLFPWTIFIVLTCSYLYAIWVVPFLSAMVIRRTSSNRLSPIEKVQNRFFDFLQSVYRKALDWCFQHKRLTLAVPGLLLLVGVWLCTQLNFQLFPKAERDSFAVEIHLSAGASLRETAQVADSLAAVLQADPRVTGITQFVGMSSPRFHMTYAPQMASNAYAQFIVNTTSEKATKELMAIYPQRYENHFPEAQIRFKQMDYQVVRNPVEIRLYGDDYEAMLPVCDSIVRLMKQTPELSFVQSDIDEVEELVEVVLDPDVANRMGISQAALSIWLAGSMTGSQLTSYWEKDYELPLTVYTDGVHDIDYESMGNLLIPTAEPGVWVPLRQVAHLTPRFHRSQLPHRNGQRCITIGADVVPGASQSKLFNRLVGQVDKLPMPEGVTWKAGGSKEVIEKSLSGIIWSVVAAIVVMFLILVIHYKKLGISVLSISQSLLCLFGAAFGLWLFDLDLGITAILGIISLIGIIVRNAIIMYDYIDEQITLHHCKVEEAAYQGGLRRMRPIFLTSATTALGVIPMILAHTMLWMPMGVVICFGTLLTLPMVVTVLPVAYCVVFDRQTKRTDRQRRAQSRFNGLLDKRDQALEEFNTRKTKKS
ncbi:MAG: efflux RND transporter permease subunit [Paludibacteraceae bacterium]|nr:efflux RND transporter permease subunit [Paludibacteraceae bacterium]